MLGLLTMGASDSCTDTPAWVVAVPGSHPAHRLLAAPSWWSGPDETQHPRAVPAETAALPGTRVPLSSYVALLVVPPGGSLLVSTGRLAWLGAGALGVFTLVASVLAHAFRSLGGTARVAATNTFMEHLTRVAGLAFATTRANANSKSANPPNRH